MPSPTSLFSLPDELIILVLRRIAGKSPTKNLHIMRQVSLLLADLSLPMMFSKLQLPALGGAADVERHIDFLGKCTIAAGHVRELRFNGAEEGIWGDPYAECILGADVVARAGKVVPRAFKLTFSRVLWEPAWASGPQAALPHLTHLELLDSVIIRPTQFPANVVSQTPSIKDMRVTYAPYALEDGEVAAVITDRPLPVHTLRFGPSVPFPAEALENSVVAADDTLEVLEVELTPLDQPPLFLGMPAVFSVRLARRLRKFKFTLPVFAFPARNAANLTWRYAMSILHSLHPDTPELVLVFECSLRDGETPYSRLAALPVAQLRTALGLLAAHSAVELVLQVHSDCPVPSWTRVRALNAAWRSVLGMENVSTSVLITEPDSGPYSMPSPEDEEGLDYELAYLWWNPDQ